MYQKGETCSIFRKEKLSPCSAVNLIHLKISIGPTIRWTIFDATILLLLLLYTIWYHHHNTAPSPPGYKFRQALSCSESGTPKILIPNSRIISDFIHGHGQLKSSGWLGGSIWNKNLTHSIKYTLWIQKVCVFSTAFWLLHAKMTLCITTATVI